ncbi:hypothetical protein KDW_54640 [Dictyobacter vulcani]|uniref:histidine kinase n=1 Tax=Dictyobacter vulcani TaxID=2607529 RepID=A0A5J4KVY0_9CHLR|nr:ATP-binding protein [Dictyobacter vulcani]GER91302.1 hypothetical protein KDW_54640 [Dictyobacter vulcani]
MSEQAWRILIVDDTSSDRQLFRHYLKRDPETHYQIYDAVNGAQGLALCAEQQLDCILLDHHLPDMDGVMFMQALQSQMVHHLPAVIFLTGSGNEEIAVKAMKVGALDYLIKGKTTPEHLRSSVINAIRTVGLQQHVEEQEFEVAQQHQAFRMVAENAPDIIARFDPAFHHIYVNPAMLRATGLAFKEVIGKSNRELQMPEENTVLWERALGETFASKKEKIIEYTFPSPAGMRYYESHLVPELNTHGDIISVLGVTRDITEKKELDQRKDTFISMISHELRTPLTAAKANLQLVQRRLHKLQHNEMTLSTNTAQSLTETASLIQRATRQLDIQNRLVQDLLDVSRIQNQKLELDCQLLDLVKLVRETVEDQRALASQRTINLHIPTDAPIMVMIDHVRIGQVLQNYLTNALKYSDTSKTVTVGIDLEEDHVRIWVQDHGQGLQQDDLEHIWERFFQVTQPNFNAGLGLGLYICQTLIHLHNGTVGVTSHPGTGSTFWFTLPLAAMPA